MFFIAEIAGAMQCITFNFCFLIVGVGNIFSIYMGRKLTVVLDDYEAVKAAFVDNGDAFAGRSPGFLHFEMNRSEEDGRIRGEPIKA